MTRIDMTTREWHELIKPVLPHINKDADLPELAQVRIEVTHTSVCAIATDRYTIGAERHALTEPAYSTPPIALQGAELAATLKLFTYSKDEDPPLRITIDSVPVPIAIAGTPASVDCKALTIEDAGGCRVVLRDHLDVNRNPLASWRKHLREALRRHLTVAPPAISLAADKLARWGPACRKGERLAFYTGDKDSSLILVLVEDHFAGLWVPVSYLDGPEKMLAESPWNYELHEIEPGDG